MLEKNSTIKAQQLKIKHYYFNDIGIVKNQRVTSYVQVLQGTSAHINFNFTSLESQVLLRIKQQ